MIRCFDDAEDLSRAAADLITGRAREAAAIRGRFTIVLSGGHTPRRTYEHLARPPRCEQIPWPAARVFWGDERCVPPNDVRANARMARAALLDRVPVTPDRVHPIDGAVDPFASAAAYEAVLRTEFSAAPPDMILLGLGEDGHTASLFPHSPALEENTHWTAAVYDAATDMHRITLTPAIINQAHLVAFLVTGRSKAPILAEVIQGPRDPQRLPAQLIRPREGELIWMVDRAAAGDLACENDITADTR